jgi:hypothetical protein
MFTLIFSQMYKSNNPLLGYVEIAFNQPLPKLYAISMMWTLNARAAGCRAAAAMARRVDACARRAARTYAARCTRTADCWLIDGVLLQDMELGRIEVLKQTQTTQHIDVSVVRLLSIDLWCANLAGRVAGHEDVPPFDHERRREA